MHRDVGGRAQPTGAARVRAIVSAMHPDVRNGLRAFLASIDGLTVIGEAGKCAETLSLVDRLHPDVAVLDCNDELAGCLRELRDIKRLSPGTRVVLVALDPSVEPAARAAGVDEFLLKGCPISQLVGAVRGLSEAAD